MRRLLRKFTFGSLAGTMLFISACGSTSDGPTRPPASSLSGRWEGDWTSTAPAYGGTARLTAQITQTGNQLTGLVVVVEHFCVSGSSSTGQVAGLQIELTLVGSGGDRTEFTGTLSSDQRTMSGTYQMFGGSCPALAVSADSGTWTVTKMS